MAVVDVIKPEKVGVIGSGYCRCEIRKVAVIGSCYGRCTEIRKVAVKRYKVTLENWLLQGR